MRPLVLALRMAALRGRREAGSLAVRTHSERLHGPDRLALVVKSKR
jgi:hypothetical protein